MRRTGTARFTIRRQAVSLLAERTRTSSLPLTQMHRLQMRNMECHRSMVQYNRVGTKKTRFEQQQIIAMEDVPRREADWKAPTTGSHR
jgi:hypothetical protein